MRRVREMNYMMLLLTLIVLSMSVGQMGCNTTEPPNNRENNGFDTTSHSINWIIDEIGEAGSYLKDVKIISDTSIWAVGAIYLNDSSGNRDPNAYNAIHWNGKEFELKRIKFYTICGQGSISSLPSKFYLCI